MNKNIIVLKNFAKLIFLVYNLSVLWNVDTAK